ncbi:MAG TPA: 3'-5' exonuclease, partial [Aggregatilineales bacterium]|nr:3'-5' exonuclease [Aggregatilineales bacterium]
KDYTFPNLLTCLASHESEQVDHATQKGDESLIEAIRDQCAGLRSFIEAYPNMSSIEGLTNKIKDLLGDSKPKDGMVIFCTVHKSKGLEADRVFILAPDKLPLMLKDMSPEQLQQEYNLLYVAETRAKNTLVIVTNPKFLKDNSQPSYVQNDFEDKVWDAPVPEVVTIEAVTPEPVAVESPTESTETFPSFHTAMSEVLGFIGTTNVLYAPNDDRKMCVSWSNKW